MRKYILKSSAFIILLLLLLSLYACRTDFSKPADFIFDVSNEEGAYTLDLSGMNIPGTGKTFVIEVKNSTDSKAEYSIKSVKLGILPLLCELSSEQADGTDETAVRSDITATIGKNEKHRYTLTVTWPAEENSYIYAGATASITIEAFVK